MQLYIIICKYLDNDQFDYSWNQRYGIVLREAPVVGMTVDRVTFIGAALRFGGHLSSNIMINNTKFEVSVIEMNFTSPVGVIISIFWTKFETGLIQNNVISMCVDDGSASLVGYKVSTVCRHDIKLNAPQLQHYGHNSVIKADVLIDSTSHRIDTGIKNSTFSRVHGMAFYYRLQLLDTSRPNSYLNANFTNSTFKHYNRGAIVLKFISVVVFINIRIFGCNFVNNSFIDANNFGGSGASGIQIIYPLHGQNPISSINHTIRISGCIFRHNTGQTVLLYKSKSVIFESCKVEENNGTGIVAFHISHLVFEHRMLFINNMAYRGAGLVLTESTLYIETGTIVTFYGNTASNKGELYSLKDVQLQMETIIIRRSIAFIK